MSQSSDIELVIYKVGPSGGTGGSAFSMNVTYDQNPKLLKITVRSGFTVDGFKLVYQVNGKQATAQFGGSGGSAHEITFGSDEVLTAVNGTYGNYLLFPNIVRSITFVTNKKTYGPYGTQEGVAFYLPAPKGLGEIVGFHGRGGQYLDAIGILVKPIDPDRFIKPDASQRVPTTTYRISNLDALVSSLSVSDDVVILVPDDSYDESQLWIKDTRYYKYTDNAGQPGFTIIHKQTGKYLLHQGNNLVLVSVDIAKLEKRALWTDGPQDLTSGFRDIRTLDDTDLVLNYARGSTPSVNLTRVTYNSDGNMVVTKGICWKFSERSSE